MIRISQQSVIRWFSLALIFATCSAVAAKDTAPKAKVDQAALEKIPARMAEFVKEGQIAGTVTLAAHKGEVIHHAAVGHADVERDRPMQKDSLFAIASMTKPITATAVMILQDEGKLSIDDPVSKYIPEFKDQKLNGASPPRPITIRDAMTHTAGLAGSQQTAGTLKETAVAIAKRPLAYEPGTRWQYSPGLTVAGRVVEVASGQSFDRFLQTRIFKPLGMNATAFMPPKENRQRVARLYKPGKEKGTIAKGEHWLLDETTPNPSGGLYSTAADLARFYQMVLNGGELDGRRIVSAESVKQMTTLQTGELKTGFTPGNGWGLGWCVVRAPQGVTEMLSPGTYGHGGAFGTQGWVDPKREMIFVFMVQRTGFGNSDGASIRGEFQRLAVDAIK